MEETSLEKISEEGEGIYMRRRLAFFGTIALVFILAAIVLFFGASPGDDEPSFEPYTPVDIKPPPVYEKPPPIVEEPIVLNDTDDEPKIVYDLPLLEELGPLQLNEGPNIFGAYGLNFDDRSVRRLADKVEDACDTDDIVDRDCIVDKTVYESENSWVCEWDCLEDLKSCETYKMHLAVAMLRKYVPPTDVFVARTDNFNFFLLYKDNKGDWIQKYAYGLRAPVVEALYNDVYHAGPITEVVFPEILEVEAGDRFCFYVWANRSCVCSVDVSTFSVGDCPQLPADLRGICDSPVEEVYLNEGRNEVCFTVDEDADEEFYTYHFQLTGGEDFLPAGNAFIKQKKWDCCVNASFKGFLSIED